MSSSLIADETEPAGGEVDDLRFLTERRAGVVGGVEHEGQPGVGAVGPAVDGDRHGDPERGVVVVTHIGDDGVEQVDGVVGPIEAHRHQLPGAQGEHAVAADRDVDPDRAAVDLGDGGDVTPEAVGEIGDAQRGPRLEVPVTGHRLGPQMGFVDFQHGVPSSSPS